MRGIRVSSLAATITLMFVGSAFAQTPPAEPGDTETATEESAGEPVEGSAEPASAPEEEGKKPPRRRIRIPMMLRHGAARKRQAAADGQSRALAPSHGAPPAPPAAAAPASPDPASNAAAPAPRTYEFGDPNVGLDGYPLAGYHGGKFYVRNRTDYFRLYVGSRLHIDSHNYFGPGVKHTDLKSTMLLRRARLELAGELMGHWQWEVQIEAGSTAFDNASGTEQNSAAPAGADPTAATATYAPVQTAKFRARPIQAYVNYWASDLFNLQVGQFNLPFTMDNYTGTNTITFMERSIPTRTWGVPATKDMGAMLWGHLDKRALYWSWAVVQGEGENRPNADNRALTAMRVYTRPLVHGKGPLELLQVGASFKYGMHDKNHVAYDYPSMSTQSGYRFWTPSYKDSVGTGRRVHIIPSGAELGIAGELRVPFDRFDLRSELVYLKNNTREGVDGFQSDYTERFGTMKGYAYYVQLSYWLFGQPFLTGSPGDRKPPRLKLKKPDPGVPPHGVEVALKWEQLRANYESASRSGEPDANNVDGDVKVDVASAGVNYWATRHMRVTVNYVLNMFPDSAPTSKATSAQRALAPGNRLASGIDDDARDSAHTLHEVTARVAVAF
jgi:phosphate-selective porin OprO and OprP